MKIKDRLKRLFKPRFAIIYPAFLYVVFFAVPDDRSILVGLGFIIPGLLIRVWSNLYAIKLDKLTTCGPYAFVRHPLYLGTFLILLGIALLLKIYIIGALTLILIGIIYSRTIMKEEEMLRDKFKEEYLDYIKKVPSFIPTFFPYKSKENWPPSMERLIRSKEYKVVLWVLILVIAFHLKEEFMVEREGVNIKSWASIIIALILVLIDAASEWLKNRKRALTEVK